MSTKTTLRVACAGAGYFSRFHYDSWDRIDRVTLVGSCNRDLAKAEATGLPAYTNLRTMLDAQSPDLLDVILPPVAHAKAIRTAIAAGVKTIICQKPFCVDVGEAEKIVAEAQAAGVTLIVHENFRFQPWYRAIKQALDGGAVGKVQQVSFRFRPGDGQGADAYLARQPYFREMPRLLVHETAVHYVDTFMYLLGKPLSVYADLRRINPVIEGEDAGYFLMEFADGVRALFDGNRTLDHVADNPRCTMGDALIEGHLGSLSLHGDGSVTHRTFGTATQTTLLAPDATDSFGGDCVHALQSHVVSGVLDGMPLENQAAEYLTVLTIEEAIYASAQIGAKIKLEGL